MSENAGAQTLTMDEVDRVYDAINKLWLARAAVESGKGMNDKELDGLSLVMLEAINDVDWFVNKAVQGWREA